MRQTLFTIPLDRPWSLGPLGEVPGFGFGLLLSIWVLVGLVWLYRRRGELRASSEVVTSVVLWLGLAVVIVKLPVWVHRGTDRALARVTAALESASGGKSAELSVERGRLWEEKRAFEKAAADYRAALEIAPGFADAHRRLAWLRATVAAQKHRDGRAAVEHANRAVELTRARDAAALDALAAAHAEAGDFAAAVQWAERAAQAAQASREPSRTGRLPDIRRRLASYRAEQPLYERLPGKFLPVYGYGFMLFLAFFASGWTATWRAKSAGINPDSIWDGGIWMFFCGIAGGRLFYILQYPQRVFADREGLERVTAVFNLPDGGLVLYGAVIGGIVAFVAYCKARGISVLRFGDVLMPSVFVGLAFGRLGCLLNGCCYGDRCELPWAVRFPVGSVPDTALVSRGFVLPDETFVFALHPSQVYMSLNGVILAVLTHAYFRYRHRDGSVLALGWLAYPVARFLIEYVRGDEMGQFNTPLTISQWVSMGLFVSGLVFLGWLMRRPATRMSAPATALPLHKAPANAAT